MKFKFNETNIMTGYIKELLRDFNLPVYTVYKEWKKLYTGKIYIKGNKIVKYDGSKFVDLADYAYNIKQANATKNLIINSSVYDAYTHTYLGDYLRFLRDYKGINLMPLYNCFNTEIPSGLNYSVYINNATYVVDTTDVNYNYYIIPAKFNEIYTIKLKTLVPYELSCIIYTGDKVLDLSKDLSRITYKKVNATGDDYIFKYSTVVNESKFSNSNYAKQYWKYEENLRILLKIPKRFNSAITVLEGDYTDYVAGNTLLNRYYLDDAATQINAVSKLSLLENKGDVSYPFADRLVEYLLGNAITSEEKIANNVARVQDKLIDNLKFEHTTPTSESSEGEKEITPWIFKGFSDIWDDYLKLNILRKLSSITSKFNKDDETYAQQNVKKSYYNILTYDTTVGQYIPAKEDYDYFRPVDMYYDLLGYVDKDTEQNLDVTTVVDTTKVKEI